MTVIVMIFCDGNDIMGNVNDASYSAFAQKQGAQQFLLLKFPNFSLTFPCPIKISSDIFAQTIIYFNAQFFLVTTVYFKIAITLTPSLPPTPHRRKYLERSTTLPHSDKFSDTFLGNCPPPK